MPIKYLFNHPIPRSAWGGRHRAYFAKGTEFFPLHDLPDPPSGAVKGQACVGGDDAILVGYITSVPRADVKRMDESELEAWDFYVMPYSTAFDLPVGAVHLGAVNRLGKAEPDSDKRHGIPWRARVFAVRVS